jgi:hypothetical protein
VSAVGRGKESVFDPADSRGQPHVNFQFHPAGLSIGDEPILHHDETDPRKALALSRELGLKPISARGEGHRDTPEEMVRDVFGVDPAKLQRPGKPRRYAAEPVRPREEFAYNHARPGQPVRMAEELAGDFAQALRTLASPNVQSFADAVRQSYQQAGVRGEAVPIIHDTDRSSRVSILGLLRGQTDPRKTLYAAAWHGMMSKSPAVDAFIAGDGPDSLLSVAMPGSAGDARAVLDKIGVGPRLIRPDQNGNEVIFNDRGRRLADRLAGLGLPVRELRGKSVRLNGMQDFRDVVREYENRNPEPDTK